MATVRARSSGERPDVAYAASVPPLTGPTVVPVSLGEVLSRLPVLSLAATEAATTLTVAAYGSRGAELAATTVELPAGVTTTYDAGRGASKLPVSARDRPAYLVLTPGDAAPVLASATYTTERGGLSVLPVFTPPTTVLAPAVIPVGG
jgi:hypothetical protein